MSAPRWHNFTWFSLGLPPWTTTQACFTAALVSTMAEEPLHLEDLDDEGEEVDYEDFNLEDFGEALASPLDGLLRNCLACFPP